ncbi:MAG: pyridoxamine 5'-phosphate oxidase family protein [Thermoflexaceae bacterium]|nr:pyridoxamine 5'-phosphate oxidase family protein [Thermoflexaceae bacterium]
MSLTMTRAEREGFLAALHVGILSVSEEGRGPIAVPIWYWYQPGGDIHMVTGPNSRKAEALRAAGRASFTVQTETPPYSYATVEGPVTLTTPDFERDIRQVAIRYLGERGGEAYLAATGSTGEGSVLVRLTPERWLTVDYGKQYRAG